MPRIALMVVCAFAFTLVLAPCAGFAQQQQQALSLELRDADLQSALVMLFKNTGKSFVLEAGAAGDVNVSLQNVPWEQALRAILEALNLSYVRDGDIYRIRPGTTTPPVIAAGPEVSTAGSPTPPRAFSAAATSEGAMYLGIIPVRHASVLDMAVWFGGTAAFSSTARSPGISGYGIGSVGAVSGTGFGGVGTGVGGVGTGYGGVGTGTGGVGTGYGGVGTGYGGVGTGVGVPRF